MVAFQIGQMRSLFIVCQMRTNSIRHYHNEAAIIHVQPMLRQTSQSINRARMGYRAQRGALRHDLVVRGREEKDALCGLCSIGTTCKTSFNSF